MSCLYPSLPAAFSPALTACLRHLLSCPVPSARRVGVRIINPGQPYPNPSERPPPRGTIPAILLLLLEHYESLLYTLLYDEIEAHIQQTCAASTSVGTEWMEGSKLPLIFQWVEEHIMGFLVRLYSTPMMARGEGTSRSAAEKHKELSERDEDVRKFFKPTLGRFEWHVYKVLGQLRTEELFDLVVSFPESQPALSDLSVGPCPLAQDSITSLTWSGVDVHAQDIAADTPRARPDLQARQTPAAPRCRHSLHH